MQVGVLEGTAIDRAHSEAEQRSRAAQDAAKRLIDPKKPYTFQVGLLGDLYQGNSALLAREGRFC